MFTVTACFQRLLARRAPLIETSIAWAHAITAGTTERDLEVRRLYCRAASIAVICAARDLQDAMQRN